jgi:hypothetical protein
MHTLQPNTRYHLVPILVAIPATNDGEDVSLEQASDAINEALRDVVADGPRSLIHDYTIVMTEALTTAEPTGPEPEEGELFPAVTLTLVSGD